MAGRLPVTKRQQEILDFLAHHIKSSGYPPSIQETAAHFGFRSLTTVVDHLNALERKGLINRAGGARTITLSHSSQKLHNQPPFATDGILVPIVGKVAAGTPILAIENIEEYFLMDRRLIRYGDTFMLRVKGDSMIEAHIAEGDLVLVKPQPDADRNDIVVAIIDGEATVKRYIPEKQYLVFKPENRTMEPIKIPRTHSDVRIVGKVVGIFRKY